MAIKVTGTTVINDSREFENISDVDQVVRKPTITSPTANETDVDLTPTITGSEYSAVFANGTRDYREFQIDLATGDFSSPLVSEQVNADSFTVSSALSLDTEHKVRIRDVDTDGVQSDFSDEVTFTTTDVLGAAALGDSVCGGFYMGTICAASTCYYLIVAPNATGCACCQWKTSNTSTSGTCSLVDGYANTYPAMENTSHPAGNWTATRTIGGFSDWYLPAVDELEVFYNNGGGAGSGDPLPSGEDFATGKYFSSSENNSTYACGLRFDSFFGTRDLFKDITYRVRAVRREPV